MIRKPRKISTFDTRFLVLFIFAVSLYHYGVKFILIDTQYILRTPYVAASNFITYMTTFLPQRQTTPHTIPQQTTLTTHLLSSSAPVLQYFDTGYARTLFIPRKNNCAAGDIVVANNCLIGRITKMSRQLASVQLITDQSSAVPVVFAGVNGIASGGSTEILQINRLQKPLTTCPAGTPVYTSGIDGVYPKNLLVGFILHTTHNRAIIRSCLNFKTLNSVEIIAYGHTP